MPGPDLLDKLFHLYTPKTDVPSPTPGETLQSLLSIYGRNPLQRDGLGQRDALPSEIERAIRPRPVTPEGTDNRGNKER